jgi:hypothetical protein
LQIGKEDTKRLLKGCKKKSSPFKNNNIISRYTYLCTIEYKKENEDIISLILVENERENYLFYQLIVQ